LLSYNWHAYSVMWKGGLGAGGFKGMPYTDSESAWRNVSCVRILSHTALLSGLFLPEICN
jgi:hypothetical protein